MKHHVESDDAMIKELKSKIEAQNKVVEDMTQAFEEEKK
jgi:hypothetical protein